jgi:hypothetical protein
MLPRIQPLRYATPMFNQSVTAFTVCESQWCFISRHAIYTAILSNASLNASFFVRCISIPPPYLSIISNIRCTSSFALAYNGSSGVELSLPLNRL